ncbi:hypothetical protein ASF48_04010 [Rathayibacter sp. Leaf299]|uniref:hypothetical protein n=1 Tax=Rathayibacter sp. Leaf299 TaxID=1736328 RepID=UPI0006FB3136|nr:hypothetical protein [Rathayibacter sp. Leaf299]KQQ22375.1 hypothetical protein ASF48_04010 [Rathayibacter sp. Leaf299]
MNDTSSTERSPGVERRTLVAGAAWTIPVVATAIGAPLAAASGGEPTLAFTNGPYAVPACGTLTDVVITATTDGTKPVPSNTPVAVNLPSGLKWSDGSTGSKTLFTDGNGQVVLSGVRSTIGNRTVQITATSGTTSATAPVSVAAGAGDGIVYYNYRTKVNTAVADSADAVKIVADTSTGFLVWQDADGDIHNGLGDVIVTGADTGTGLLAMNSGGPNGDQPLIWYKKADGVHYYNYRTKVDTLRPNSTNAATIVANTANGYLIWQDANGDIRNGNGDLLIPGAQADPDLLALNDFQDQPLIWYKKADGVHQYNYRTKVDTLRPNSTSAIKILADTASQFLVWQDANGDIRNGNGDLIITGAETGSGLLAMNRGGATGEDPLIWYKKADGIHYYNYRTKVDTLRPNSTNAATIIADTATGFLVWQDTNGDIRNGNGDLILTGTNTGAELVAMNSGGPNGDQPLIWYKKAQPCA